VLETVFIVDDDDAVRKSLSRLLRVEDIATQEFASGDAFLSRQHYDGVACVLLDINMPRVSGMEVQARLVERQSDWPIVFLTGHGDVPMSVRAMKRGAVDFLLKPVDEANLLRAVRQALDHHRGVRSAMEARALITARLDTLTPRELQVTRLLITGAANKVVGCKLQIATKTVKVHRGNVMKKMGVRSVAELLRLCSLVGVEPDTEISAG
jgi:FixJ family two-component response regulator